jgi:hypothetical protein
VKSIGDLVGNYRLLAKSTEDIQIALDNAQSALLEALESDDPRMRMITARLMLKTRQARERGWSYVAKQNYALSIWGPVSRSFLLCRRW